VKSLAEVHTQKFWGLFFIGAPCIDDQKRSIGACKARVTKKIKKEERQNKENLLWQTE